MPAPPEITFNPEYEFIGWKPELPKVYPDTATTYIAQYKPKPKSKIIFQIQNSAEGSFAADVQTEFEGVVGTSFNASQAPTPTPATNHRFKNWNNIPATFTESTQYVTAVFEKKVTVTFSTGDHGAYISTSSSGAGGRTKTTRLTGLSKFGFPGETLTAAGKPTADDGWEFSHWSPSVPSVFPTSDQTYTAQYKEIPTSGTDNGHEWVDLGLTSGNKWAKENIGAGDFNYYNAFNYNQTAYYQEADYYTWGSKDNGIIRHGVWDANTKSGYLASFKKYAIDQATELDTNDDIAYHKWGRNWRIPSKADFEELLNECYWVSTERYQNDYRRPGYIVYKVKNSAHKGLCDDETISSQYNENSPHIFLHLTGLCSKSDKISMYYQGYYWTRTLFVDQSKDAYRFNIGGVTKGVKGSISVEERKVGMQIRPIMPKQ